MRSEARRKSLLGLSRPPRTCLALLVGWLIGSTFWTASATAQDAVSAAALTKNREKIASLSDPDRAELVRKFQEFQKLSESEREQLRSLHRDVAANPSLNETMKNYCQWLKDLDVTQRQQLRAADTPEKKRVAVERIRQEQQQRQKDETQRHTEGRDNETRLLPALMAGDELKAVMTALESSLVKAKKIDPVLAEQLNKLEGTLRYKRLLQIVAELRHPKEGPVRLETFLPEEFKMALLQAVPKGSRQNGFDRIGPPRIFYWLLASLLNDAQGQFAGERGDELRETLFKTLPPQRISEFLQFSPEMLPLALKRTHLDDLRHAAVEAFELPRQTGENFRPENFRPMGDGRAGDWPGRGIRGPKDGGFGGPRKGPPPDGGRRPDDPERRDPPPRDEGPRD